MKLHIRSDQPRFAEAFHRFPQRTRERVGPRLRRAAIELAREMRREAPKAESTLTNSISHRVHGPFDVEVFVGVNYAGPVHDGRSAGSPMPPVDNIADWISVKRIAPRDPDMTDRDLAFAIARSIATYGIEGDPFADRAVENMRPRIDELINLGIEEALS